ELGDALGEWATLVLDAEPKLPESLEVLSLNFEYRFNKHENDKLVAAASEIEALDKTTAHGMRHYEAYDSAKKQILSSAGKMQKNLSAIKDDAQAKKQAEVLLSLYKTYLNISDPADPSVGQVNFNLAEVSFRAQTYSASTEQYQSALAHWTDKAPLKKQ